MAYRKGSLQFIYPYQTLAPTLREGHQLQVFENKTTGKCLKLRKAVARGLLHIEEIVRPNSISIVGVVDKSRYLKLDLYLRNINNSNCSRIERPPECSWAYESRDKTKVDIDAEN